MKIDITSQMVLQEIEMLTFEFKGHALNTLNK